MIKRFAWVVLVAFGACHDDDTVSGPDGQVAYPGINFHYVEWSACGRHSVTPAPDYSNPEARVDVQQRDSHFTVRIPDLGTLSGELAPYELGVLRYSWTLRFEPPCSGFVQGSEISTDYEMRFPFAPTDDWRCAPCTDPSGGMVRLFIPPQPI
jgi:hypothetical protein